MSDPLTDEPDEPDGYKPCPLCGSTIPDEPNELDDLRAEVSYLRAAVNAERAAVVRWLRERALVAPNERSCLLQEALAFSIEIGAHRREEGR